MAPPPKPPIADPPLSIEEIFNFDKLIDQLGLGPAAPAAEVPPVERSSASEGGYGEPELVEELETSERGPELASDTASAARPKVVDEIAANEGPAFEDLFAEPIAAESSTLERGAEMLEAGAEADPLEDFLAEIPTESSAEPPVTGAPLEDYFAEQSPAIELAPAAAEESPAIASALEPVEPTLDDSDSLAVMERQLRELEQQRAADERRARLELAERRRGAMVGALETWLSAILADRQHPNA